MSLEEKTALITGSTSGIGLGIAEEMAKAGCNIILNGLGEAAAIKAIQDRIILNYGVRVRYIEADVSNPNECRALISQTLAEYGGLDILVNNAGIQHVAPVESFPRNDGMRCLPSIFPLRSISRRRRFPRCEAKATVESSISLRLTVWSAPRINQRTLLQSMGSSDSPRSSHLKLRAMALHAMPSVPVGC